MSGFMANIALLLYMPSVLAVSDLNLHKYQAVTGKNIGAEVVTSRWMKVCSPTITRHHHTSMIKVWINHLNSPQICPDWFIPLLKPEAAHVSSSHFGAHRKRQGWGKVIFGGMPLVKIEMLGGWMPFLFTLHFNLISLAVSFRYKAYIKNIYIYIYVIYIKYIYIYIYVWICMHIWRECGISATRTFQRSNESCF